MAQNKKLKTPYGWLLLIVVIMIGIGYFSKQYSRTSSPSTGKTQTLINANVPLKFTRHARCRMNCRGITEGEIREVLREGVINYNKSNPSDKPCPSYAIEDRVEDGQMLRIVFGLCDNRVSVITCIDLENNFDCSCN